MRALSSLIFVAVVLVASVLMGGSAVAGDYHVADTLVCSDCHTMHYSLTHTYTSAAAPPAGTLSGGPNPRLLKQPENQLCASCHDGTSTAPDVIGNNTGTSYVRNAGALNKTSGNDAGYDTYMGHTLGSTATAPGGTWADVTDGLSCSSCHSTHNSTSSNIDLNGHTNVSAWRNVKRSAGGSATNRVISYETVSNTGAYDVFEPDPTLGQISVHYDIDNRVLNEPLTDNSGFSDYCMKCHTDFHSTTSTAANWDGTDWLRHPTAEVDMTDVWTTYSGKTNKVPVMSSTDPADDTSTPTCVTCHKAHGNKNPFGLIEMSGTGTVSEEGDSDATGMRDLCKQCHTQGG